MKHCFLESCLTKSFTIYNFRNKVAMTSSFFSKCLKGDMDSRNAKKIPEKVFGLKDNSISIGARNPLNLEKDIFQVRLYESDVKI